MSIKSSNINYELLFRFKRKCTVVLFSLLLILTSCDSEDANDCLQTDGEIISYSVELPIFTKIQMEDDIRVKLKQGSEQNVIVETGENLVSDLLIEVRDNVLVLQNNNGCNFIRDYGRTLVTITSPNIDFIRQASSFEIESIGTLSYPELLIWSNTNSSDVVIRDPNKSGSVILDLDVDDFRVFANGSSNFIISGMARNSRIIFSDEFPQLDARSFLVDDLIISHVSAAHMIVHPINSLSGQIRATGDVISVNQPPQVDVEEFFTGRLIFE